MMVEEVKVLSGKYNKETKVLDVGKKPFGIRTYEQILEDLEHHKIKEIDLSEVSVGKVAQDLIYDLHEVGVPLKLSQGHERELLRTINSGTKQIDELGEGYIDWLINNSEALNNPFMVVEKEGEQPSLVQYLGVKGDEIRLKKVRSYATQPIICERELKLGRDVFSIMTIHKSDILTKKIVWRFLATEQEYAIAETLQLVIKGQLSFRRNMT